MDRFPTKTVVILCSGFGLGFYIPGLLISERLRRRGIATRVEVFENLLPEAKIQMVEKNRRAYHQSFRVALTSQKIPGDTRGSVDPAAVESLVGRWHQQNCGHFICLSGHWVHILNIYRDLRPDFDIQADLLYLDADLSPSWKWLQKLQPSYATGCREVRLYDRTELTPLYSIDTNMESPPPYAARGKRLVVHGGGWGIGTFNQYIPDIEAAGYGLDVVRYEDAEVFVHSPGRRYFMDDPTWRTWHLSETGELTFPPFGEVLSSEPVKFVSPTSCHGLHRVIRNAQGIVSKPGAGTLIDSFGSATPLIMLEPFGPHEERNAEVWSRSHFGVPYAVWAKAGYPVSMLEELHGNLLRHRGLVKDYASDYVTTTLMTH